ncbi:RagB/SusD family nutrient uptake outer membrane protein [Xanthocytophaga agilis]|uniref:RagB/SusD family nutrient uptake outer membrane protein n=1 Tax=Xanthocytophaga agilis TaxID=3048010 RepID=A0AAE3UF62_9BACT|nr:RagB/SusD family nutrient uptake outer membrane protein [Xanthocytophaga agilis]MDJ1501032.1 RagB/SusD family nutrient uptake outer membrane protein [Xanthocytophaga agilis]
MKSFLTLSAFYVATVLILSGCNGKLDEEPKSILVPSYFKTAQGIDAGVTAAYSGLRYQYGPEGSMIITVSGTDEFSVGDGANTDGVSINAYNAGLSADNGQFLTPWNNNFTYINTCNGVIDFGPEANLDAATRTRLIAEAQYLRAHYYFLLVQTYGAVPLDLGSGVLKFNTNPISQSERSPVGDVYAAIITDLTAAATNLPDKPFQTGRASKAAAKHLLAKVYLTRAGSVAKQSDDYQRAFETAKELIDNKSVYGLNLLQDFGDVNKQGQEHSSESIFTVEHTSDLVFNESDVNAPASGLKENRSLYLFTPYYEIQTVGGKSPVIRDMNYQRPWRRFAPTSWLLNTAFADKTNDSRYDNTFRTVWFANTSDASRLPAGMSMGDTAFYMPGRAVTDAERAAKKYRIYAPSDYTKGMYPHMKKFDDTKRAAVNYSSTRAFMVHKFSETYLIAAEAALMMGNKEDAVTYLNVLRQRAAYRPGKDNSAAITAMTITDPNVVTLDFILDERSRELCGEQHRWFDLVRTGKLIERVKLYNPEGAANIQERHTLRPIPQSQINLTVNEFPQNPGY